MNKLKINKYIVSGENSYRFAVLNFSIEKHKKRQIEKHEDGHYSLTINKTKYHGELVKRKRNIITVDINGNHYEFTIDKDSTYKRKAILKNNTENEKILTLKSPMPGKIYEIFVTSGSIVKKGEPILILEAMKMQNQVLATTDSKILEVKIKEGDNVFGKQNLLTLEKLE